MTFHIEARAAVLDRPATVRELTHRELCEHGSPTGDRCKNCGQRGYRAETREHPYLWVKAHWMRCEHCGHAWPLVEEWKG